MRACRQAVLGSGKVIWNPVEDQLRTSKLKEQHDLRESKLRDSLERSVLRTEAFLRDSNASDMKESRTRPPAVQCA